MYIADFSNKRHRAVILPKKRPISLRLWKSWEQTMAAVESVCLFMVDRRNKWNCPICRPELQRRDRALVGHRVIGLSRDTTRLA